MANLQLRDQSEDAKNDLLDEILHHTAPGVGTCLEWTGSINEQGYGEMVWEGRTWLVHRAMYTALTDDPIPEGMVIMHLCDNRQCCNPRHLCPGTHSDNMQDMWDKGRDRTTAERELHPDRLWSRFQGLMNEKVRDLDLEADGLDGSGGARVTTISWLEVSPRAKELFHEHLESAKERARVGLDAPPSSSDQEERETEDRDPLEDPRLLGHMRHFYTKVVGVTYPNDDGTDRQEILRLCQPGEELVLEHDPDNPYDANAVKVLRESGEQLGFIGKEIAARIVAESAQGWTFAAILTHVTGGAPSRPSRGANLILLSADAVVDDWDPRAYYAIVQDADS